MARIMLHAVLLAGLAYSTLSTTLQIRAVPRADADEDTAACPTFSSIAAKLAAKPADPKAQADGCLALQGCLKMSSKVVLVGVGFLEAAIAAQRRFPQNKQVQTQCTRAVSKAVRFNREHGLRAGHLGGLNLTLEAYLRWMDDSHATMLPVVAAGSTDFNLGDQIRAISGELGSIQLHIQNIKNHLHSQGRWDYEPVRQSLFGLSSHCWKNQDICQQEGFLPLSVQLLKQHTNETTIPERALEAVNALIYRSDDYRSEFAAHGGPAALVKVLRENQYDAGALATACEVMTNLVGPGFMTGPKGESRRVTFNGTMQKSLAQAGAVEALLDTVLGTKNRTDLGRALFKDTARPPHNADAACLRAGQAMVANGGRGNAKAMLRAGIDKGLRRKVRQGKLGLISRIQACVLLRNMAKQILGVRKC